MPSMRTSFRVMLPLIAAIGAGIGCASFSNPTTFPSVPVRRLPDQVLGKPREEQLDIPQPLLRQEPPAEHIVGPGDVLGIAVEGATHELPQVPPITYPPQGATYQNIGVGFPFPVIDDGTIALPNLPALEVNGLTLKQVRDLIRKRYLEEAIIRKESADKAIVTLIRPRQFHILVLRQDSAGGVAVGFSNGQYSSRRGTGFPLDLPIYENDVLNALTRSGGLPGTDAKNEVVIQRGALKGRLPKMIDGPVPGIETVRVPLRLRPGEAVPFTPKDVVLKDGDILFIQSRDTEVFYTAGLIPTGEYPLPRDSDLDVLEAVMAARGPVANGGINFNNLQGNIVSAGLGAPSPSQVTVIRKCPGNRQITIRVDLNRALQDPRERLLVQPGDILVLQETLGESLTRYITSTIRYNFFSRILSTSTSSLTTNSTFP